MAKIGTQMDVMKSTPARTTTKREPGRSDATPEAKCLITKAFPTVPTSILKKKTNSNDLCCFKWLSKTQIPWHRLRRNTFIAH